MYFSKVVSIISLAAAASAVSGMFCWRPFTPHFIFNQEI